MSSKFPMVTCKSCNTVAFEVPRAYAVSEVKFSTEWLSKLSSQQRSIYEAGNPSIKRYEKCWCGASYRNFRDYQEGDAPDGVTLSPIIKRNE